MRSSSTRRYILSWADWMRLIAYFVFLTTGFAQYLYFATLASAAHADMRVFLALAVSCATLMLVMPGLALYLPKVAALAALLPLMVVFGWYAWSVALVGADVLFTALPVVVALTATRFLYRSHRRDPWFRQPPTSHPRRRLFGAVAPLLGLLCLLLISFGAAWLRAV